MSNTVCMRLESSAGTVTYDRGLKPVSGPQAGWSILIFDDSDSHEVSIGGPGEELFEHVTRLYREDPLGLFLEIYEDGSEGDGEKYDTYVDFALRDMVEVDGMWVNTEFMRPTELVAMHAAATGK